MAKELDPRMTGSDFIDNGNGNGNGGQMNGNEAQGNFWDTLRDGFGLVAGVFRAQTASLLERQSAEQRDRAQALRSYQKQFIERIQDPRAQQAFVIQQAIEQAEIDGLATQVRLARFERNSQYIEGAKSGVGLISDYSPMGGGMGMGMGMGTFGTPGLGTALLAAGVGGAVGGYAGARAGSDDTRVPAPVALPPGLPLPLG